MTDTIKPHTGCQYFGCRNDATRVILDSAGRKSYRCKRHATNANKRSPACNAK